MEKTPANKIHMHPPVPGRSFFKETNLKFEKPTRVCNATMPSGTLKISEPAKRPGADNYKKHSSRGTA